LNVWLRPLAPGDLAAVHELLSDHRVVRHMLIPLSATVTESRDFLSSSLDDEPRPGQWWRSAVRAIMADDLFAGMCGIVVQSGSEEGEIWYLVHPAWQRRGLATQAALQLLALGFDHLQLHRVFACCVPQNRASARVLRKIGMRFEGLRKKNLRIQGEWTDSELYAMLDEEWASYRTPLDAAPCTTMAQKTSFSAN
jgi:RimJ/RimL family protein N-acetyltransferase